MRCFPADLDSGVHVLGQGLGRYVLHVDNFSRRVVVCLDQLCRATGPFCLAQPRKLHQVTPLSALCLWWSAAPDMLL